MQHTSLLLQKDKVLTPNKTWKNVHKLSSFKINWQLSIPLVLAFIKILLKQKHGGDWEIESCTFYFLYNLNALYFNDNALKSFFDSFCRIGNFSLTGAWNFPKYTSALMKCVLSPFWCVSWDLDFWTLTSWSLFHKLYDHDNVYIFNLNKNVNEFCHPVN